MRIREGSQAKTGMAEEKETKGIDYQTWEFTGREYLEIAGISLGIAAAVNLLCYRAWWACIAVVPVGIVCFHTYRKAGTVAGKRKHSGTGTAPDAS